MKQMLIFPNDTIQQVLVGTPTGHRHLRILVETDKHLLVFHEATLANLVRAFVTVKTHPRTTVLKLAREQSNAFRPGFATSQLLEQPGTGAEFQKELDRLFAKIEAVRPKHRD